MARKKIDWADTISTVNSLMQKLKRKPRALKIQYYLNPGSILNAYREGDITFKQAVKALNRWQRWKRQKQRRK